MNGMRNIARAGFKQTESAECLAGDRNMMEVTRLVHYRFVASDDFSVPTMDGGDSTVRTAN